MEVNVEPLFFFALVWSVGGSADTHSRVLFDSWLRAEMSANAAGTKFPTEGLVYDYLFVEDKKRWMKWMDTVEHTDVNTKISFSEIIVQTMDSVRNTYFLDTLLRNNSHVLMVGDTGTGKTVNIAKYLSEAPDFFIPMVMSFSAQTSANQVQDTIDSKLDKRKKGVFGPPLGKRFILYVDDLNMPKKEEYGAQPPIEILRQWFGQSGWYDRKVLSFREIVDFVYVTAMGPPGGGRNPITPRFIRHFNVIGYAEMSNESKDKHSLAKHLFCVFWQNR
jgi:dynein heavy chain